MPVRISVELPDHEQTLEWLTDKEITEAELDSIVRRIALETESELKQELTPHTRTGVTRASIETRREPSEPKTVAYGVGSWVRGNILHWLDQGRGWIFPVMARILRWWSKEGEIVFSRYSKPSPAFNVMAHAVEKVWSKIDSIVEEVLRE